MLFNTKVGNDVMPLCAAIQYSIHGYLTLCAKHQVFSDFHEKIPGVKPCIKYIHVLLMVLTDMST